MIKVSTLQYNSDNPNILGVSVVQINGFFALSDSGSFSMAQGCKKCRIKIMLKVASKL